MKIFKYIVVLICLSAGLGSCNSLDLAPEDYYGSGNFWNNEAQVEGFVVGMHSQMRNLSTTFWVMGEARGGLQKDGVSSTATSLNYSSPIKDQDFTKDKTGIASWGGLYGQILNINLGIDKVENECPFLSDESRGYYLGQLYGIRAFYYFWLYRTYGGVPLATDTKVLEGTRTAEPLYLERSSPKETLDFIKNDVEKSINQFGSNQTIGGNKSHWSKFASLMLKAEVYLWSAKVTTGDQTPATSDLSTAEAALNEVKGQFSLQSNFNDVFSYNQKGNSEIIFSLRFMDNEATNNVSQFVYSDNVFIGVKYDKDGKVMGDTLQLKGNGLLRNEYYFDLFESYSDLDKRKEATFLDFYDKNSSGEAINGGLILRKFLGLINSNGNRVYADDIPVYRYADVLLMLAEVENKKGGDPSSYINQIRQRAYGSDYNAAVHAYTNQGYAANELAILYERDKEFVFENKRWFDVLRLQDAGGKPLVFSSTLDYGKVPVLTTGDSHKVLWPVDVTTLNNDPKLTQTPGYEL
ncbi:RagB/SusD family nutrient uptake outer membrane protein [Albibacterium indicum]|uniref:RagB/SusD family nutrient uptake outer membrane protein n=1 Tax=Albibacterium indicum TaxID=2292082 RepID=UPI000E50A159|nr:RagB/SusD family nutrient uptake outer membrane protein [Pedobacter indicus]